MAHKYWQNSHYANWDVQLPREKCYHYLGNYNFSIVNVYFLCLQWLVSAQCVCVCMCTHGTFEIFLKFTDIIYINSLLQFKGFATVNKGTYIDTLQCIRDAVRRKRPNSGEPTVGFFFLTMLQHTGQIWSRNSHQRTMWQPRSTHYTLLT
jgi:hypothetical protein